MEIIKRDGRVVPFSKKKIENAILKAFKDVEKEISDYAQLKARNIANYIEEKNKEKSLSVEEIQDLVENGLMSLKKKDIAKSYIKYREERNRIRQKKTILIKDIAEKINATNVQNSNANMDEKSFGGRKGAAADTLMKDYALNYCMSEMSRNNHLNNEIYIHKLNCA